MHKIAAQVFLLAFLACGIMMSVAMPPFQVPDEPTHWSSALYRISKLHEVSPPQGYCSLSLALPSLLKYSESAFHFRPVLTGLVGNLSDAKAVCVENDSAGYGTLGTYFQVVASSFLVAKTDIDAYRALAMFYAARILGGMTLVFLLWRLLAVGFQLYGIVVPGFFLATAIAASPLFLQQAFGVSADTICNAAGICLATVFISGVRVKPTDLALLIVFGLGAATTKPTLAPLFLIIPIMGLLLFPPSTVNPLVSKKSLGDFFSAHRKSIAISSAIALALCATCFVYAFTSVELETWKTKSDASFGASSQLDYIIGHPVRVFGLLSQQAFSAFKINIFFGPLGWINALLSIPTQKMWYRIFSLALIFDLFPIVRVLAGKRSVDRRSAAADVGCLSVCALAIFASMLAVELVMYLQWTAVGADFADGIQMRYYFPGFIVACFLFSPFVRLFDSAKTGETDRPKTSLLMQCFCVLTILCLFIGYAALMYVDLARRFW